MVMVTDLVLDSGEALLDGEFILDTAVACSGTLSLTQLSQCVLNVKSEARFTQYLSFPHQM